MTKREQNLSNPAINAREILYYLSKANRIVLELEIAIIKRLKTTCADGEVQIYYPVIAEFIPNYEEQVVITNIKSGIQCPTCTVPANKHENLHKNLPLRTYKKSLA